MYDSQVIAGQLNCRAKVDDPHLGDNARTDLRVSLKNLSGAAINVDVGMLLNDGTPAPFTTVEPPGTVVWPGMTAALVDNEQLNPGIEKEVIFFVVNPNGGTNPANYQVQIFFRVPSGGGAWTANTAWIPVADLTP